MKYASFNAWEGILYRISKSIFEISLKLSYPSIEKYRQVSNIRRTLAGNKIDDHSDVVGASPVGAAPTASSLST